MKFTMTKIAAAAALALASSASMAAQQSFVGAGTFDMYDLDGALVGGATNVTGYVDWATNSFKVASTTPFFGLKWTASGGTLYGPGTYTVSVNGDGSDELVHDGVDVVAPLANGDGVYTFTVGAGQIGGNINFAWGSSSGIDVFQVWNVTDLGNGNATFTSTDFDGDGILGGRMVDGAFPGFSANFNFTAPVPEASTYGMMLAGLGLVGFAVRRRKLIA